MKTFEQALNAIKSGKIDPIYVLIGQEKFYHDQLIHVFSQVLFSDRGSRDLNEIVLYGTENTLAEVLSQATSYPMLAAKKLVVVREFEKMKITDAETFEKYLAKPAKFTVLVLSVLDAPKNKFFQKLQQAATVVDCKPITESRLPHWLVEYCKNLGYQLQPEAAHFLIANVGTSILELKNEIEKVINFKNDNSEITIEDVQHTSGMHREANIFALQKALGQRQLSRSIEISRRLLESGVDATMINAVLFAFFRKALMVAALKRQQATSAQIKQKMHLYDFQLREINETLKHFNFAQLKKVIRLLHGFDKAQKGIDPTESRNLEVLCYKICRT